jgi:TonB family protein
MALAVSSSPCLAQASKPSDEPPPPPAPAVEYDPKAWKDFVSQEGGFSVSMPAPPKPNRQDVDTPMGKIPAHFYVAETGAGGYAVGYADFPKYSESPDYVSAVLDGARDKVLAAGAGRKLLREKEITVEGYGGREWLVADGQMLFRAETFLVKGRFYQLVLLTPMGVAFNNGRAGADGAGMTDFYEGLSKRFFGSFKLLAADTATGDSTGSAAATPTEGEVDRLLKSLREKGETVYFVCAEGTKCQPSPDVSGTIPADKAANIHVITKPQPEYPLIAKAARAQGNVVVQAVVDEEGKVIAAQAISGNPLLQAAAVKASREARFSPMLLEGKPVKVVGTISYNFALK